MCVCVCVFVFVFVLVECLAPVSVSLGGLGAFRHVGWCEMVQEPTRSSTREQEQEQLIQQHNLQAKHSKAHL